MSQMNADQTKCCKSKWTHKKGNGCMFVVTVTMVMVAMEMLQTK